MMNELLKPAAEKNINPERVDQAIANALDGYAKDGGTWLEARDAFYRERDNSQKRIDEEGANEQPILVGLSAALGTAKEGAVSLPVDALKRFYDTLALDHSEDESIEVAITAALDGYAKDGGTWLHAREVFYQGLAEGLTQKEALVNALETAKEDAETHPVVASRHYHDARRATQPKSRLDREYAWESSHRGIDGSPIATLEVSPTAKKIAKLGIRVVSTVRSKLNK